MIKLVLLILNILRMLFSLLLTLLVCKLTINEKKVAYK